jgi:hypothetical protein
MMFEDSMAELRSGMKWHLAVIGSPYDPNQKNSVMLEVNGACRKKSKPCDNWQAEKMDA